MQIHGPSIPSNVPSVPQHGEVPAGTPRGGFTVEGPTDASSRAPIGLERGGDALFGPWKRLDSVKQRLADLLVAEPRRAQSSETTPEFLRAEDAAEDPTDFVKGMRESNFQLLHLQMEAQSCTLEIELLSKVTEQSTSSAKQVLQTQA